jgi:GWxTD domain-containing protein
MHAGRPGFTCEAIAFQDGEGSFAAVRIEIPYNQLSFAKTEAGYGAQFDLIVLVLQGDRQVNGDIWHEVLSVPDRATLGGRAARYHRRFLLPVPPGQYTLEVAVSEPSSGQEGRVRLALLVPLTLPNATRVTPLLVGACGLQGAIADLMLDARVRTDFTDPPEEVCVYADLIHPEIAADSVTVRWTLAGDTAGDAPARGEERFAAGAGRTRLQWRLPITARLVENYRLQAAVEVGGEQVSAEAAFGVLSESTEALDPFFRDMLDALTYIADESEVDSLRMAAPDARRARWDEFWKRRDPTPETERNEAKDEFLERLHYANAEFAATRPGWMTDRGRIYIRYGAPDLIEREPIQSSSYPVEIWHYDAPGLVFVFVDRGGYGEYVLIEGTR